MTLLAQSKVLGLFDSCINPYVRTRERIQNITGTGFEPVYQLRVATGDEENSRKGEWILVEIDKVNAYELIQSHRDAVDLQTILKKYQQTGDESLLNQVQKVFADVTNAPKNLADAYALIQNGIEQFKNLPLDVRKEYNNNPSEWFEAVSNGEFFIKFAPKPDGQADVPPKEYSKLDETKGAEL